VVVVVGEVVCVVVGDVVRVVVGVVVRVVVIHSEKKCPIILAPRKYLSIFVPKVPYLPEILQYL
jgi:hypothetical protein